MNSTPARKSRCRLLLFDLDGTLLDSRKRISPRNRRALADCRAAGILIGVATARSEPTAARYVAQVAPDVLISNSGALVRVRGEILYRHGFTREEAVTLVRAGVAEGRGITVDCDDTTYSNRVIDFFNEPGITYTDYSDFGQSALKICIEGSDTAFAEKTAARIDACSWLAFSDCDWFKFSKQGVSKGDALAHVASASGIGTDEMTAFGDDYVDTEMLAICGVGVAMANAPEAVRQAADVIIGSNDTDAIADYLEKNVLSTL